VDKEGLGRPVLTSALGRRARGARELGRRSSHALAARKRDSHALVVAGRAAGRARQEIRRRRPVPEVARLADLAAGILELNPAGNAMQPAGAFAIRPCLTRRRAPGIALTRLHVPAARKGRHQPGRAVGLLVYSTRRQSGWLTPCPSSLPIVVKFFESRDRAVTPTRPRAAPPTRTGAAGQPPILADAARRHAAVSACLYWGGSDETLRGHVGADGSRVQVSS
jgi:hypothetical protein